MLRKSRHLEHRRRLVPCGSNQRHRRFPSTYSPSFLRQHFPKLLPSLRQRTHPLVVATVDGQTVNCFAYGGNSPPGSPRAARRPRTLRRLEYVCQSLTLSCAPSLGALAARVTILSTWSIPWRYHHSTKLLG